MSKMKNYDAELRIEFYTEGETPEAARAFTNAVRIAVQLVLLPHFGSKLEVVLPEEEYGEGMPVTPYSETLAPSEYTLDVFNAYVKEGKEIPDVKAFIDKYSGKNDAPLSIIEEDLCVDDL